jgi:hypothetical protein
MTRLRSLIAEGLIEVVMVRTNRKGWDGWVKCIRLVPSHQQSRETSIPHPTSQVDETPEIKLVDAASGIGTGTQSI